MTDAQRKVIAYYGCGYGTAVMIGAVLSITVHPSGIVRLYAPDGARIDKR